MVYGGRPSLGCHLCRKRRIKCDESRPTCRNCARYGRQCPGYREDSLFRDETRKIEKFMSRAGTGAKSVSDSGSASRDPGSHETAEALSVTAERKRHRDANTNKSQPVQRGRGRGSLRDDSASVNFNTSPNTTTAATAAKATVASFPSAIATQPTTLRDTPLLLPPTSTFSNPFPLKLFPVMNSIWEDQALCYFFDQFTSSHVPDTSPGHMEYLPVLYARCKGTPGGRGGGGGGIDDGENAARSCLRWAVDAASLLTLGNQVRSKELALTARRRYGLAIRGLRNALASRTEAAKDETFTAVLLLALFEDIIGERNGHLNSHTLGLELLIQLRGRNQFRRQEGCNLFEYAYTHTLVQCLVLGDKPRFNMEWALGFLDESDPVHQLMMTASEVSRILMQITSLNSIGKNGNGIDSASGVPNTTVDTVRVSTWIESCKRLDQELDQWTRHLPDHWLPLIVYSKEGHPLITYQHIWISFVWVYYRSFRVLIRKLLLGLYRELSHLDPQHGPASVIECEKLERVSKDYITDICRSIPFLTEEVDILGCPIGGSSSSSLSSSPSSYSPPYSDMKPRIRGFRAHGIIGPLWHVLSSGLATPSQVQQIRSVLAVVGTSSGIKLALNLVEELDS